MKVRRTCLHGIALTLLLINGPEVHGCSSLGTSERNVDRFHKNGRFITFCLPL